MFEKEMDNISSMRTSSKVSHSTITYIFQYFYLYLCTYCDFEVCCVLCACLLSGALLTIVAAVAAATKIFLIDVLVQDMFLKSARFVSFNDLVLCFLCFTLKNAFRLSFKNAIPSISIRKLTLPNSTSKYRRFFFIRKLQFELY